MLRGRDNMLPASLCDCKSHYLVGLQYAVKLVIYLSFIFYKLANDLISSAVIEESQRTVT